MPKKNEKIPETPSVAEIIKPADLVSENTSDPAPAIPSPDPIAPPAEKPETEKPLEASQPAPATVVTPSQLVTENLPPASAQLPPQSPAPKRGRGRPKGSTNKSDPANSTTSSTIVIPLEGGAEEIDHDNPVEEKPAVNHRQLAEITFDLTTNSLAAIVGPEWRTTGPDEREAMIIPLEMYLKTKQMNDIPPGAILCFAIATYAAPRMRAPATRTKIAMGWAWMKSKWSGRKQFTPKVVDRENPFSEKS